MENIKAVLFIVYIVAGWWAANRTVFANHAMFGSWSVILKLLVAIFFGWILIPVAIIKGLLSK